VENGQVNNSRMSSQTVNIFAYTRIMLLRNTKSKVSNLIGNYNLSIIEA